MTIKKDGGPAYPSLGEGFGNPEYHAPGMTLRDWFASHASETDIEEYRGLSVDPEGPISTSLYYQFTREQAKYRYADAMIKEREE